MSNSAFTSMLDNLIGDLEKTGLQDVLSSAVDDQEVENTEAVVAAEDAENPEDVVEQAQDDDDFVLTPNEVATPAFDPSAALKSTMERYRESFLAADTEDDKTRIWNELLRDISVQSTLTTINATFSKIFGKDVQPSSVFGSKQWNEFSEKRVYGTTIGEQYREAAARMDVAAITQIFSDFKDDVRGKKKDGAVLGAKKPPVTPRSSMAASRPTAKQAEAPKDPKMQQLDLYERLMSGRISQSDFRKQISTIAQ